MTTAQPCAKHPSEQTYLRCADCEAPICPKCMVAYEVGFKCPDCAKKLAAPLTSVNKATRLTTLVTGLGIGAVYGWGMGWLSLLSWFAWLAGYALGILAGRLLQRITGYRLTLGLYRLALAGILFGFAGIRPELLPGLSEFSIPFGLPLLMTWAGFAIFLLGVRKGFSG